MVKILKRIMYILAAMVFASTSAYAYDATSLPNATAFADASGIYDGGEISSATICDMDRNVYRNLTNEEIDKFYATARNMTVWRKINPTPFRGACVNFTTVDGAKISYYFNAGLQIGMYGTDNFVCYMPASGDANELTYLLSEFYDTQEDVYGGMLWNVATEYDFLKLPNHEWARAAITEAAAKSLVPYEFTDKYEQSITREQMAVLICNFITVAGNYANMDEYMKATGTVYLKGSFIDCRERDEAIDCLYALSIIDGVDGTRFNPDGLITREEASAIMTRVAEKFMYVGTDYSGKSADWGRVSPWAEFYVKWCIDKGLFVLDDDRCVYPTDNMTVEQAITVLSRLFDIATYWES